MMKLPTIRSISIFRRVTGAVQSFSAVPISNLGGAIIRSADGKNSIHLPPAEGPVGLQLYKKSLYCPSSQILRTSAHVGTGENNAKSVGTVGIGECLVSPEEARTHARNSGLRLLATIHNHLDGDLSRVEQVLQLTGVVNAEPNFTGHANIIDGCSQILADALGEDRGVGTRACFGTGSLGATVACYVEVRVRPPPVEEED